MIARLVALVPLAPEAEAGPGDDCAVIDPGGESATLQLLKTDALAGGVHFEPGQDGEAVGWKAVARVISDFAAMGGRPERFLVTVALAPETRLSWVEDVYRGMGRCMKEFGAVLAGGETTSLPAGSPVVISVAATGVVERESLILRSGGRPGDVLLVSGTLGGSIRGKHLNFVPRVREARWLAGRFKPSAMMDLSDGLAKDLPRLAAASGCGFELDRDRVPVTPGSDLEQALCDGEDFELLIAIPPDRAGALLDEWETVFPGTRLTAIGRLVEAGCGDRLSGGWDHFANKGRDSAGSPG